MADQERFVEDTAPFMDSLFGSALRLTRNRADAEDLLQETFLRAYRGYGRFEEGTNLRACGCFPELDRWVQSASTRG